MSCKEHPGTSSNCLDWRKEFSVTTKDLKLLPEASRCVFCFLSDDCEERFGEFLRHQYTGLSMHYFCLLLSSGLLQSDPDDTTNFKKHSIYGFLIKDIMQEVKRASKLSCSYCHKRGASIGCVENTCKTKLHFPCGSEASALFQFYGGFSTFCRQHRPVQEFKESTMNKENNPKEENRLKATICPICLERTKCDVATYQVLQTPCCFSCIHRTCVQQQALSSGTYFFRCPTCNDTDAFSSEMSRMGIYVPERDASWELAHDAFSDLLQRHSLCDVTPCVCPHGKDYNLKGSKWAVVLCDLCGSSGTHIACSDEVDSPESYYVCALCSDIHGREGARELAIRMGVITPDHVLPRRSGRRKPRVSRPNPPPKKRLKIATAWDDMKETIM